MLKNDFKSKQNKKIFENLCVVFFLIFCLKQHNKSFKIHSNIHFNVNVHCKIANICILNHHMNYHQKLRFFPFSKKNVVLTHENNS